MNPLTFIRNDVQSMQAYAIQDGNGMVKLDAMENPYVLPSELQHALGQRLGAASLNRYPYSEVCELKKKLAGYIDLPSHCALMLGNGSDELISLLAMACLSERSQAAHVVLAPAPGFVMYEMSAKFLGLQFVSVDLTIDFELNEQSMLEAVERYKPAVTYLAYPNNPTANLWDVGVMKRIIAACAQFGGLVVIDEAYQPFSAHTWMTEIRASPEVNRNVLLMRTFSKFGLAGIRLGYLMGIRELIDQIDKLRPPYNVSTLNAQCALFALEHQAIFAEQAVQIKAERARLSSVLETKSSVIRVYSSQANMILVRVTDAEQVFNQLKAQGILVKNVSKMHPLLSNCLRLTVGTADENNRLLAALNS